MIIYLIALIIFVIAYIIKSVNHKIFGGGLESTVEYPLPPKKITDIPFNTCVPPIDHSPTNKHHGQRKLFIAELELLTMTHLRDERIKYFVYAGSAPGVHIGKLMELFPMLRFILVDPNEFNISENGKIINYPEDDDHRVVYLASGAESSYTLGRHKNIRGVDGKLYPHDGSYKVPESEYVKEIASHPDARVFIIEKLMTRSLARALSELDGGIVFMSDIRTNSADTPTDGDLLWNMAQMFVWVAEMKPLYYSHKHRPILTDPVIEDYMVQDIADAKELGLDLLKEPYVFLGGDVYLQAWTTRHSPETRLVGKATFINGGSDERLCGYLNTPTGYKPTSGDAGHVRIGNVSYPLYRSDIHEYDQKMLYHNRINRGTIKYDTYADHEYGIDDCYDCSRESHVWEEYYIAAGIVPTPSLVTESMIGISRWLVLKPHGDMREHITKLHNKQHKTKNTLRANTNSLDLLVRGSSTEEQDDHQYPEYDPAN